MYIGEPHEVPDAVVGHDGGELDLDAEASAVTALHDQIDRRRYRVVIASSRVQTAGDGCGTTHDPAPAGGGSSSPSAILASAVSRSGGGPDLHQRRRNRAGTTMRHRLIRLLAATTFSGLTVACTSGQTPDADLDQVLIGDPSILVHDTPDDGNLFRHGFQPGPGHDEFDDATIRRAVQRLFEQGDGDDLYVLHRLLVPASLNVALQAGGGVPQLDTMPDEEVLVRMDDVLDDGILGSDFQPPDQLDPTDLQRVLDAGLARLLTADIGLTPADIDWEPVITVLTNPLPLDTVEPDHDNDPYYDEYHATVLATISANGYLGPPNPEQLSYISSPMVDPVTQEPLTSADSGEPIRVGAWNFPYLLLAQNRFDNRHP